MTSAAPTRKTTTPAAPMRSAADIAAAAVTQAESKLRAARCAAVKEWRDLVFAIADGHEPDGASLQRIAELTALLRLPAGVLADHVRAVQEDRRIAEIVALASRKGDEANENLPKLQADLAAAEQRVRDLTSAANQAYYDMQSGVFVRQRIGEHRERFPILFDDLENVEV